MRALPAVLRVLRFVYFDRAIVFHRPADVGWAVPGVEFVKVPQVVDRESENRFHNLELRRWITTDLVWTVEHDTWLVDPDAWRAEMADYDYIGAPWDRPRGPVVGNSGFGITSRRYLDACWGLRPLFAGKYWPRDIRACETFRAEFEREGVRFAPWALAARWSFERGGRFRRYAGSLGMHGVKSWKEYVQ
jgi:hypothetical protein